MNKQNEITATISDLGYAGLMDTIAVLTRGRITSGDSGQLEFRDKKLFLRFEKGEGC